MKSHHIAIRPGTPDEATNVRSFSQNREPDAANCLWTVHSLDRHASMGLKLKKFRSSLGW